MKAKKTTAEIEIERNISLAHHGLQSCKAAFRLLQGAVILGHISVKDAKGVAKKIAKNDGVPENFADNFFRTFDENSVGIQKLRKEADILPFNLYDKTIIVVDDESESHGWDWIFALLFKRDNVNGAKNQDELDGQLKAKNENAFCILVDLKFPKSAWEGIRVIQNIHDEFPQIPIIVFSATDSINFAKEAYESGAWNYFTKEPGDKEFRHSVDYYKRFHSLISSTQQYQREYLSKFWRKIKDVTTKLNAYKVNLDYRKEVAKEIQSAYTFLTSDTGIYLQFSKDKANNIDEVVLRCMRALEILCTLVIVENKLLSRYDATPNYLGQKIGVLKNHHGRVKGINQSWTDRALIINEYRKRVVHSVEIVKSNAALEVAPPLLIQDARLSMKTLLDLVLESQ